MGLSVLAEIPLFSGALRARKTDQRCDTGESARVRNWADISGLACLHASLTHCILSNLIDFVRSFVFRMSLDS